MKLLKFIGKFIAVLLMVILVGYLFTGRFELRWNDVSMVVVAFFFSSSYGRAFLQWVKNKFTRHP